MPKFPRFSTRSEFMPGSVYERFRDHFKIHGKDMLKLHIGDTYQQPVYPLPIAKVFTEQFPDFNRYCHTFGIDALRKALAAKVTADNGLNVSRDHILVTSGATNALSASTMGLIDAGEEVIVLTPCWPFYPGMVRMAGATVVEVPLYMTLFERPDFDIASFLERFVTERTAALYMNSPNNPSGKVLNLPQFRQIAEFAERYNLWIISDEAYDTLTFDDREHISIATLPGMTERTLTVFTFSKIFMFAGLRLGYLVAPPDALQQVNKAMVHELYGAGTMAQQMMIAPVETRQRWMKEVRSEYQRMRDLTMDTLKIRAFAPEGTGFVFFDLSPYLQGRTFWEVVEALLDRGVSVAPGEDFGRDFATYVRLCFTGEPPDRIAEAMRRIHEVLLGS
jgi:aspartate/methionine/tyrosine aminotransferase